MKKAQFISLAILLTSLCIFTFCRSTNDDGQQKGTTSQEQSNPKISTTKHLSKWDNGFSKKVDGDDVGWFQTPDGAWIDTMREEQHKYNAYPPHYNNKTYYPNFTIQFPDNNKGIINTQDYFNISVKDLNQNFVAKVNPIKDSKIERIRTLKNIELLENNNRFLNGFIIGDDTESVVEESAHDDSHHDHSHHNHDHEHPFANDNRDEIMLDLKQFGDVFISQVTIWKPQPKIEENQIQTEVIVYNDLGKIIYQKIRNGSNSTIYVSKNKKFLIESGGGYINEDSPLPNYTTIYNLNNQKEFWHKKSLENCISAGIVNGSNFAMINIVQKCDYNHLDNELYSLNLENGKIFQYISKDKAPMSKVRISDELDLYYNTKQGKKLLSLDIDFREINSLP